MQQDGSIWTTNTTQVSLPYKNNRVVMNTAPDLPVGHIGHWPRTHHIWGAH